ncbi:MAG: esterase [Alistipes sp.]|nr:esterase [Alistipes sp.]
MKRKIPNILHLIFALIILATGTQLSARAQSLAKPQYKNLTIQNQGLEREFKLYLPAGIEKNAPLIFVLHGYGGNNNFDHLGFNELADKHGIVICYPLGSKDKRGHNCWNVGYPFQDTMEVDDVQFLCDLARQLQKEYGLSRKQTFCTGMSNGGEMCYLLAYSSQKVFKAVAPVAGLTMAWMPESFPKPKSCPLFEIHGTEDRVSEWTGDLENKGGWGAYIAVPDAIDFWVKRNNCPMHEQTPLPLKHPKANQVISHKYFDKKGRLRLQLYEILGGGHTWGDSDLHTPTEIWNFFTTCSR